jgi:hypothetical protein
VLTLLAAVAAAASGCGESDFDDRQAVAGTVTLDGQPLAKALISFIPTGATLGPKASGVVIDGQYLIAADDGPCPGDFMVKIEPISPDIEALAAHDYTSLRGVSATEATITIAARYNLQSELAAQVRGGVENRFDYALERE